MPRFTRYCLHIRVRRLLQERHRPLVPVRHLILTTVWAEIWHYVSHRAFHTRPLHWIHLEHHRSHVNTWMTAISFSFPEKLIFDLGLLLPLAVLDTFVSLNFLGIAGWYIGYLVINSFSHANFELKPRTSISSPERSSPARHITHCIIRGTPVIMAWARGCWIGCSRRNGPTTNRLRQGVFGTKSAQKAKREIRHDVPTFRAATDGATAHAERTLVSMLSMKATLAVRNLCARGAVSGFPCSESPSRHS